MPRSPSAAVLFIIPWSSLAGSGLARASTTRSTIRSSIPRGYPYPAYGVYAPYGYGPRGYALSSSLRIQVTPRQAEVYVDGYRAGVVDDFDGIFQRLALEPGGHDIVIYLEGYRTWTSHMYFTPGSSQNVKFALTPLASGEVAEARPVPAQPAVPDAPAGMRVRPPVQIPGSAEPRAPQQPPPPPPPGTSSDRPAPRPLDRTAAGSVGIRVQPSGAEIFIDGERWQALGNGDQLVVQLAEGKHHVEVRKSGYETFSTDVDVARGVMLPLNISLKR